MISRHTKYSTVVEAGFQGLKNGCLLQSAAAVGFEALITVDQNLLHQQNLKTLPLAVLVLIAPRNNYELLSPLVSQALVALQSIRPGEVISL